MVLVRPHLGLIGGNGAGKDTVAGLLAESYGYHRLAFADGIRAMLRATDPEWVGEVDAHGYEVAKRRSPWVRQRMLDFGSQARSLIHPDVWIQCLHRSLGWVPAGEPVVVSDVRTDCEARFLRERGFTLVRVHRAGVSEDGLPAAKNAFNLRNDGTVGDLRINLSGLLAALRDLP